MSLHMSFDGGGRGILDNWACWASDSWINEILDGLTMMDS